MDVLTRVWCYCRRDHILTGLPSLNKATLHFSVCFRLIEDLLRVAHHFVVFLVFVLVVQHRVKKFESPTVLQLEGVALILELLAKLVL